MGQLVGRLEHLAQRLLAPTMDSVKHIAHTVSRNIALNNHKLDEQSLQSQGQGHVEKKKKKGLPLL